MLILVTGEPGASKTLNTIKLINEDEAFKGRDIYYHGIKELTLPWTEIDKIQVQRWFDLPDNSVIVIDEAQYHFPPRQSGSKLPESVLEMSTHRHSGIDIILITQHPTFIDAGMRKLVNTHYHYERPFQTKRPRRIEFQQCANDPRDYHARLNSITTTIKLDKKYFNLYKSAETHTHKQRIPKKVWILGILIIAVIAGGINFARGLTDRYDPITALGENNIDSFLPGSSGGYRPEVSEMSYQELHTPRITGLPHTSPFYDELNEPVVRPMPQCIYRKSNNSCTCYTQQASLMAVPWQMCRDIVKYGYFDAAREPTEQIVNRDRISRNESLTFKRSTNSFHPNVVILRDTLDYAF